MRVDRIDLYHVAMPLIYPWRTAYGEDAAIHSVLCRISSGDAYGWGESSPLAAPCYSPEWGGGVFQVAKNWFGPALLGADIQSADDVHAKFAFFKGNPFAKALFDNAWWSLQANVSGQPLHRLLGANRDEVPVGADFGVMDHVHELLPLIGEAIASGFPRIKLKFRPGWDLGMLAAVREIAPEHPIHIDCNSGYRLRDLDLFRKVDDFHLSMIEQPLQHDDLIDHAQLQSQIRTPVCLDESITTIRQTEQAIGLGSCRFVNIKPGRVGGLSRAVAIHDVCAAAKIPCWVGGMLESAVGASQCVALAMLDNFTYPADIFPSSRFYHEDLADPPIELHRSTTGIQTVRAMARQPEPIPARLKRFAVQQCQLT